MCAPGKEQSITVTSVDVDLEGQQKQDRPEKRAGRPYACCKQSECQSRCIFILRIILALASFAFLLYYLWSQLETLLACVALLCLLVELLRYEFNKVQESLTQQALLEIGYTIEKSCEDAALKMEEGIKDAASKVYGMLPSKEDLEEQFAKDTRAAMAGLESALAGSEEQLRHVGERVAQHVRKAVEDETQAFLQQLREWWQLKNLKVDKLVEPVRSSCGSCRSSVASCMDGSTGDYDGVRAVPIIDTPMAAKQK